MKVFLVGSGASCGTFCSSDTPVPVGAEFGQVLHHLNSKWHESYKALAAVVSYLRLPLDTWPLEPVWTHIDYRAKFNSVLEAPTCADQSYQLKKALLDVYGQRCDCAAERLPRDSSYTLGMLLRDEIAIGDVLVSFNYDTIVERLVRKFDRPMQSVRGNEKRRNDAVNLVKPHGSLSWAMVRCTCDVLAESADGSPLLDSLSPKDVDEGREPLVLGTVPIKSELIRQVQAFPSCCGGRSWVEVYNTITRQWQALVEAVHDADHVIVVGYGFPKEDQYGRFLIQEGMRDRTRALTVELFELRDKAPGRAKDVIEFFEGHVATLVIRGPVEPPKALACST